MTMFKKKSTKKSTNKDIDRLTIVVENGGTKIEGEISNSELFMFLMGGVSQMWEALIDNIKDDAVKFALTTHLLLRLETLSHRYLDDDDSDDD